MKLEIIRDICSVIEYDGWAGFNFGINRHDQRILEIDLYNIKEKNKKKHDVTA